MVGIIKKPLSVMPEGFVWLEMSAQAMLLALFVLHECSVTGLGAPELSCPETFLQPDAFALVPPRLVFACMHFSHV